VFTRGGKLYAASFDRERQDVTDSATPMSGDIAVSDVQGRGALAVAENGTVAYVTATSSLLATHLVARRPEYCLPEKWQHLHDAVR
jgi:hypothetical protein